MKRDANSDCRFSYLVVEVDRGLPADKEKLSSVWSHRATRVGWMDVMIYVGFFQGFENTRVKIPDAENVWHSYLPRFGNFYMANGGKYTIH